MFLFDSNTFIEAKQRYYAFDIAPGFWRWMDSVVAHDVRTITSVRDELIDYGDELSDWVKARKLQPWMLGVDDVPTQEAFARIASELSTSQYNAPAVAKFLSGADPWLIAKAEVLGAILVTHEVAAPDSKKRVPIPNLCASRGIKCINTFDVMRLKAVRL